MKKKYSAMFSAAIAMIMTACGTISPPTAQTTTAVTTAETNVQSLTDLSSSSDSDSKVDSEKIQSDTFIWFCQYHLTHFIRTRIMQRERYDHSRAFFGLPEAARRWRCRFFCWPSNSYNISRS